MSLAFLSTLFNWRDALNIVRPETRIRWHRAGWRSALVDVSQKPRQGRYRV
jgi:hypothetical protein